MWTYIRLNLTFIPVLTVFFIDLLFHNELVVMHLVSCYCKPFLLYGTESLGLTITQLRSLEHTWLCAISHIFHINCADVKLVANYTATQPFDMLLLSKRHKFLSSLCHVNNSVVQYFYNVTAKHELHNMSQYS